MPTSKKKVRASADAPPADPVAAAIAAASGNAHTPALPPGAVDALRRMAAYNDTLPVHARTRVSSGAAIRVLREHYGVTIAETSTCTFNALVRRELGRKSWGTP